MMSSAISQAFSSGNMNLMVDQASAMYYPTTESGHQEHPKFWHLAGLVCEAVLEVVCVSSLGFIAAKKGLFPAKVQKDVANLNIYFFTPCLIFSKLAAQLTADKLTELWIIPIILIVQTFVSWLSAEIGTRLLKINRKPQRNFVKAMAVFGNSNSLPLSLVISLSHTISGLHWEKIPGDNDDEVGARGILYLLVFSQLGQAVRWSWGMNSLLKPMDQYTPAERGEIPRDEEISEPYKDEEEEDLLDPTPSSPESSQQSSSGSQKDVQMNGQNHTESQHPVEDETVTASGHDGNDQPAGITRERTILRPQQEEIVPEHNRSSVLNSAEDTLDELGDFRRKLWARVQHFTRRVTTSIGKTVSKGGQTVYNTIPRPVQKILSKVWFWIYLTVTRFMGCLNVPLAAIILSVIVGSVPSLRAFFYTPGSFVNNTVTSAINQLAGVAVPLILFVLGGNLCKSSIPDDHDDTREYRREKRSMLWCSLICRMLIPLCIMAPFLAVIAKFTPISILDDPIFIIVCFLLTGAPSALQLAQICQVNDVFVPVISQLLVQSYVVWIFPSTLILVMLALEVVKWAQ